MKLESLTLTNYKGYDNLSLEIGGRSTVIAGVNGAGKSSVLSSVAYLMHVWLNRLNPAQGKAFEKIPADAVSVGAESLSLSCVIELCGTPYTLERTRIAPRANNRRGEQSLSSRQYSDFTDAFRRAFLSENVGTMPVFAHYGVNRSVTAVSARRVEDGYGDKLSALERASENETNFQKFFEWYREQEADEAIALRRDPSFRSRSLEMVRRVVCDMVDGVEEIHVRRNPTRMTAVKDGKEIRVDLLSDGEKCTLAMFGDLVKRLTLANPGLENPLEGEGLVLIDEVELHLHPAWQRLVLGKLRKHFPRVQFVVSTHSPQVLGEASNDYNIFLLDSSQGGVRRVGRLDVFDTNLILEEYMGAASQNPLVGNAVRDIFHLVDDGQFGLARSRLEELAGLTGFANRDYIMASNYLKRGVSRHEISQ